MNRRSLPALFKLLSAVLAGALAVGCAGGGGNGGIRYYVVDPVEIGQPIAERPDLALEIIDLQVPQYLERYQIATRTGQNRLHFSDAHQWGENLRKNLMRTISRNLSRLLVTDDVATPLNRSASRPNYRIQIALEEFERQPDGRVTLAARWQITDGATGEPLITERSRLVGDRTILASDFDATVAEMRALFGRFSRRVAQAVETLQQEARA